MAHARDYDLGMTETVLEDVPMAPPTIESFQELLDRLEALSMTRPIAMAYAAVCKERETFTTWDAFSLVQKTRALLLFAVYNASIRSNSKFLAEQAT